VTGNLLSCSSLIGGCTHLKRGRSAGGRVGESIPWRGSGVGKSVGGIGREGSVSGATHRGRLLVSLDAVGAPSERAGRCRVGRSGCSGCGVDFPRGGAWGGRGSDLVCGKRGNGKRFPRWAPPPGVAAPSAALTVFLRELPDRRLERGPPKILSPLGGRGPLPAH